MSLLKKAKDTNSKQLSQINIVSDAKSLLPQT